MGPCPMPRPRRLKCAQIAESSAAISPRKAGAAICGYMPREFRRIWRNLGRSGDWFSGCFSGLAVWSQTQVQPKKEGELGV